MSTMFIGVKEASGFEVKYNKKGLAERNVQQGLFCALKKIFAFSIL